MIRCGGVEIIGIEANVIPKKRIIAEPVLESYKFIPHNIKDVTYSLKHSIRNFVQVALENVPGIKVKSLEVLDKERTIKDLPIVSEMIADNLADLPLIQAELSLFVAEKDNDLELDPARKINIISDRKLTSETNCLLIVVTNGMSRMNSDEFLNSFLPCLRDNAFIINREAVDYDLTTYNNSNYVICQEHWNVNEKLVLLKKMAAEPYQIIYQNITNFDLNWIAVVQDCIKNLKKNDKLILVSENESLSGILGFINCLRREQGADSIHCIYINDPNAPKFDPCLDFYESEIRKNLAINIYQNGKWGTYRHLLLFDVDCDDLKVDCFHSYANVTTRGDLSSLTWIKGPLNDESPKDLERCLVYVSVAKFSKYCNIYKFC